MFSLKNNNRKEIEYKPETSHQFVRDASQLICVTIFYFDTSSMIVVISTITPASGCKSHYPVSKSGN